ncbi:MAG TPA: hypothetical protein PLI09_21665 [Candidatus Hydrogenedentes bacterium]|nr:hypothetical protein [Candidatus Hydrogenedentota bacterium]
MDKLFNLDMKDIALPKGPVMEESGQEIPGEIRVDERPFLLPAGIPGRSQGIMESVAMSLAKAEAKTNGLEQQLAKAQDARADILLSATEILDVFEHVLAGFSPVSPTKSQKGGGAKQKKNVKAAGGEPISEKGLALLMVITTKIKTELLEKAGVTEKPIRVGDKVDPERDNVLETVQKKGQADGTIAHVVKKAYFDAPSGRYLRKSVVKAVRNVNTKK